MKLRAQGIKPSKTNIAEIQNALQYRPNQKPLIEALQNTLGYQQKIFAQMQLLQQAQQRQQNNAVMGAGQMPSDGAPRPSAATKPRPPRRPRSRSCLMLDEKLLNILVCPADRGPLILVDQRLYNPRLHKAYRIDDGIPVLLVDEAVEVSSEEHERLMGLANS